jgi:hypothetical protein
MAEANRTYPVRLPTGQAVKVEVAGAANETEAREVATKAVASICGLKSVDASILDAGLGAEPDSGPVEEVAVKRGPGRPPKERP